VLGLDNALLNLPGLLILIVVYFKRQAGPFQAGPFQAGPFPVGPFQVGPFPAGPCSCMIAGFALM